MFFSLLGESWGSIHATELGASVISLQSLYTSEQKSHVVFQEMGNRRLSCLTHNDAYEALDARKLEEGAWALKEDRAPQALAS